MLRPATRFSSVVVTVVACVVAGCGAPSTDPKPVGEGTEIGDEGSGWLCVEDVIELADPEAVPAGFAQSPADVLEAAVGAFSSMDAQLSVESQLDYLVLLDGMPADLEGDVPAGWTEPECPDLIYLGAVVELEAPGLYIWTEWAGLTISEAGVPTLSAGATLYENYPVDDDDDEPGTDEGPTPDRNIVELDGGPTTFDLADMMSVEMVVHGTPTAAGWDLVVTLRADSLPQGEDANVVAFEEQVWAGSVEAD